MGHGEAQWCALKLFDDDDGDLLSGVSTAFVNSLKTFPGLLRIIAPPDLLYKLHVGGFSIN